MGRAEQVLHVAPAGSGYCRVLNRRNAFCLVAASFILQFITLFAPKTLNNSDNSNFLEKSKSPWSSCGVNLECGRFEAPIDYSNRSSPSISIYLTRYLANDKASRLGSIFVNPGGPGGSGAAFVFGAGEQLSKITGGKYDIVGWDPRGVGETRPPFECFDSQTKQDIFAINTDPLFSVQSGNMSDPFDFAAFKARARIADARSASVANLCEERSAEIYKHMGTTSVVRDLVHLHTTLEGPEKPINYWGFSYGTIIGSYLVNMFPELVGRVVIDGVVDPHMWANIPPHKWPKDDLDNEKALGNFYNACVNAGPQRCALAHNTSTPRSVGLAVDKLLKDLHEHPLPVPHAARPGVLPASMVQTLMYGSLSRPRSWPAFAQLLSSAINGNGEPILNAMAQNVELDPSKPAKTEIFCSMR